MYHNSGDLSNREGFDLNQVRSIAKVQVWCALHSLRPDNAYGLSQLATLLNVAGFELSR